MSSKAIVVRTTTTTNRRPKRRKRKNKGPNSPVNNPRSVQVVRRSKKVKAARQNQMVVPKFKISPCTQDYMRALVNPFGYYTPPCVPDLDSRPSAKYRIVTRSGFGVGTAGMGYCVIAPFNTLFNDLDSGWITSALFTGSAISTTTGTGVSPLITTTAPFTSTSGLLQGWRIVGCGLRIRYVGTELNRGGRILLSALPNSNETSDTLTATTLLGFRTTVSLPVTRAWRSVIWTPKSNSDFNYGDIQAASDNRFNKYNLVAMVHDSVAGNAYELEVVNYAEYVGSIVNVSPSHSDITGMSALKNVISELDVPSLGGLGMYNMLENAMSGYIPHVTSFVATAAAARAYASRYRTAEAIANNPANMV